MVLEYQFSEFVERVNNRKITISVIGLGHVGLPLALILAKKGFKVHGIDSNKKKIHDLLNKICYLPEKGAQELLYKCLGRTFFPTESFNVINECDFVIICVPTPVDKHKKPDISILKETIKIVAQYLKLFSIVIIESTIAPLTTKNILEKLLKKYTNKFGIAHCPERIAPGGSLKDFELMNRVVGGTTPQVTKYVGFLYRQITTGKVIEMSNSTAAELSKLFENVYRDVNIALANTFALIAEQFGIDVMEIINAANTKQLATTDKNNRYGASHVPCNIFYPGCGVGGHCIPVDTYYLIEKCKEFGYEPKLLTTARKVNENMPIHFVKLIEKALNSNGKSLEGAKILVLGLTYKGDVKDIRNSPAKLIIDLLLKSGATVYAEDPLLSKEEIWHNFGVKQRKREEIDNLDCIAIVTDHKIYREIDLNNLNTDLIIDGRNIIPASKLEKMQVKYFGVGRIGYQ
jgi:nucleotide sugar dehydrogenase